MANCTSVYSLGSDAGHVVTCCSLQNLDRCLHILNILEEEIVVVVYTGCPDSDAFMTHVHTYICGLYATMFVSSLLERAAYGT